MQTVGMSSQYTYKYKQRIWGSKILRSRYFASSGVGISLYKKGSV